MAGPQRFRKRILALVHTIMSTLCNLLHWWSQPTLRALTPAVGMQLAALLQADLAPVARKLCSVLPVQAPWPYGPPHQNAGSSARNHTSTERVADAASGHASCRLLAALAQLPEALVDTVLSQHAAVRSKVPLERKIAALPAAAHRAAVLSALEAPLAPAASLSHTGTHRPPASDANAAPCSRAGTAITLQLDDPQACAAALEAAAGLPEVQAVQLRLPARRGEIAPAQLARVLHSVARITQLQHLALLHARSSDHEGRPLAGGTVLSSDALQSLADIALPGALQTLVVTAAWLSAAAGAPAAQDEQSAWRSICAQAAALPALQVLASNAPLCHKQYSAFADALAGMSSLTELRLVKCGLTARSAAHLLALLQHRVGLATVDLSNNPLCPSAIQASSWSSLPGGQIDAYSREALQWLAKAIAALPALRALCLDGCIMGDDGVCEIAGHLAACTRLQELSLCTVRMSERGASALISALREAANAATCQQQLRSLSLVSNRLGNAGCAALADHIDALTALRRLDISSNGIKAYRQNGDVSLLLLLSALQPLALASLCADGNVASGAPEADQLGEILTSNTPATQARSAERAQLVASFLSSLRHLSLELSPVLHAAPCFAQHLLPALRLPVLTYLNLTDNGEIGKLHAELAQGLSTMTQLRELDLRLIKCSGWRALSKALAKLEQLQTLRLSHNTVGATGAVHLAAALCAIGPSVRTLELCDTKLDDAAACALAAPLATMTQLAKLNLFSNGIGPEGACALARALRALSRLTQLDIGMNALGKEGATAVTAALARVHGQQAGAAQDKHVRSALDADANAQAHGMLQCLALDDVGLSGVPCGTVCAVVSAAAACTALTHLSFGGNGLGEHLRAGWPPRARAKLVEGLAKLAELPGLFAVEVEHSDAVIVQEHAPPAFVRKARLNGTWLAACADAL